MEKEATQKLPLYELKINEDDGTSTEVNFISLVENPAIQIDWVAMSEDGAPKRHAFKIMDAEKQILMGPVMVVNTPIYRKDPETGDEYYVTMTAETVRNAAKKFMKNKYNTNINKDHSSPVEGVYVLESWFVEDPKRDKSSLHGFNLKQDDWCVTLQVEDTKFWNDYITGKGNDQLKGFSVEGLFQRANKVGSIQKVHTEDEFSAHTEDLFFYQLADILIENQIKL